MANPIRAPFTATGTVGPWILDWFQSPFNVSIGVDLSQVTGGCTYGVEYCLSDIESLVYPPPNGVAVTNPLWRNDPTIGPGSTTSGGTGYNFPVQAVRVVVTAFGSGTGYVEIVQGMNAT